MSLLIVVLCVWTLIVMCAVALCAQAGHADDEADAGVTPPSSRFHAAA